MTFLFLTKSLKSSVCLHIAHLSLNAKFSLEILDLNLDFIKFTAEKVDSHIQVVQIYLKVF